jgi:hypothetical protein
MTNGMTLAGMAPVQHSFLNNPYINRVLTGIIIAISLFFVSGDYWLLKKNGDIAYDGRKDLYAEDSDSNPANDRMIREVNAKGIEGGLVEILFGSKATPDQVKKVQDLMVSSGLSHTVDPTKPADRAAWQWFGKGQTDLTGNGTIYGNVGVDGLNMGKSITLSSINNLFASMNSTKDVYRSFIEDNYRSAASYLGFTSTYGDAAQSIYNNAYSEKERTMISYNMAHRADVHSSIPGATETQGFGDQLRDYKVNVKGSFYNLWSEDHTGVDLQRVGAKDVLAPDGYWNVYDKSDNTLILQRFGTNDRLRLIHLNPADVSAINNNSIFGTNEKIVNYPDGFYGNTGGENPHVHFDITTMQNWSRAFINPYTGQASNTSFYYWKKASDGSYIIPKTPFARY